jgi:hypothetical protein
MQLAELIGKDSVFMDVDSIALGRDFRQILQERLESCDLMLALIGPGWMDAKDASGNRRLDSPTDLVRQEIAAALKRNIPVTPVLLQGVQMPDPERLPEDIKDLAYRNGFELGHSTWESDVKEMVKRLGLGNQRAAVSAYASTIAEEHPNLPAAPGPFKRSWLLAAVAAIAITAGLAGLLFYSKGQNLKAARQPAPTSSEPAVSSSGDGLASSGLEFMWPGDDCWDIFRGKQLVTFQCGAKKQALQAGTYTIKGKFAPVFMPFDVTIKSGSTTRINMGGILDFNWTGDDCWDIFRGEQFVTFQCGAKKQALQAGSYTIKGKFAAVFMPINIKVADGAEVKAP